MAEIAKSLQIFLIYFGVCACFLLFGACKVRRTLIEKEKMDANPNQGINAESNVNEENAIQNNNSNDSNKEENKKENTNKNNETPMELEMLLQTPNNNNNNNNSSNLDNINVIKSKDKTENKNIKKTKGFKSKCKKVLKESNNYKKLYGGALFHLYDVATDIGVLVEWYHLYLKQINNNNQQIIEGIDMLLFFIFGMFNYNYS